MVLHKRYEIVLHGWGVGRRIKFKLHKFAQMLSSVAPMLSSRSSSTCNLYCENTALDPWPYINPEGLGHKRLYPIVP